MTAADFTILMHGEFIEMHGNRIKFIDDVYSYFVVEARLRNGEFEKLNEFNTYEEAYKAATDTELYKSEMEDAWGMDWERIKKTIEL